MHQQTHSKQKKFSIYVLNKTRDNKNKIKSMIYTENVYIIIF